MRMHYYRIYKDYTLDEKIFYLQEAWNQDRPAYIEGQGPVELDDLQEEIDYWRRERGDDWYEINGY